MAKFVDAHLIGQVRMIQPDSFKDQKTGEIKHMTKIKFMTGSLETDDEAIHDINFMHENGATPPKCLEGVQKAKFYQLPVRIKVSFDGKGIEVQGGKSGVDKPALEIKPAAPVVQPGLKTA